jgi:hypothetical protein
MYDAACDGSLLARPKSGIVPRLSPPSRFTTHRSLLTTHAFLIGTAIRLEFDLTPSAPIQNAFLIGTIHPTLTPAPLFTHYKSLTTRHCLTPFLFDTNKPHKIIILASRPLKTKEKQLSIRYKWSLGSIGNLACALRFRLAPMPSTPPITHPQSPLTITTSALDSLHRTLLIVGRTPIQERP